STVRLRDLAASPTVAPDFLAPRLFLAFPIQSPPPQLANRVIRQNIIGNRGSGHDLSYLGTANSMTSSGPLLFTCFRILRGTAFGQFGRGATAGTIGTGFVSRERRFKPSKVEVHLELLNIKL